MPLVSSVTATQRHRAPCTVQNSDFAYIGGNGVVAWGYTNETATDPGRPGVHDAGLLSLA